ncbi:hypothetical protein KC957_02950 [Candidatus Saccharibacteria bacterium]|nr:hypothetical protein [Candidatus Saccharibacteria bacterium]
MDPNTYQQQQPGTGQPVGYPTAYTQPVAPVSGGVSQYPPQPTYPGGQVAQGTPGQPMAGAIPGQPPTATPPVKSNPNSTQNSLQIAEIRDGIVIMNDGSFRSVVMVKSINFDLMSPQEREAVEFSYQGFLNSLYFPLQIFVRSQKIDLSPYIERLDKIRSEHDNMLLSLLMEDYIQFIGDLSQQTNIMDKKFYVVIPFEPFLDAQRVVQASKGFFSTIFGKKEERVVINEQSLEQAKSELKNRVQAVMAGLQQCQVKSVPLGTQELIELYYDAYNPDTATRQQMANFNELNAPIVTKGEGVASQPNLDRELT